MLRSISQVKKIALPLSWYPFTLVSVSNSSCSDKVDVYIEQDPLNALCPVRAAACTCHMTYVGSEAEAEQSYLGH